MYINPYEKCKEGGQWLKANFHTHAGTGEGTCGAYAAEDVVALYKQAGYGVLCLSNHDYYLDTAELATRHDMTLFNGFEYSPDRHMLCIDVANAFNGTHQEVIDETTRQGGFVILCHPNWITKEYWPWKAIDALSGYAGIEIYNGVIFRLSGSGLATDTWDYLLSQGKLVWGFANDDFHRWFDLARTWNMIYSPSGSPEDIKDSILSGCFYTSTGLILNGITVSDKSFRISAEAKDSYIKACEYVFWGKDGKVLARQTGEYGQYEFTGEELYVRAQVISEHGAMLWTQPVYKKGFFKKP